MTYDEFSGFMKGIYSAFPDIYSAIKFASPQLKETHAAWFKVLGRFELGECEAVLDAWIDGSEPLPSKEDVKRIAFAVRAIVAKRRAAASRSTDVDGEEFAQCRERRRAEYQPSALGLLDVAEAMKAGLRAKQAVLSGEISEDDARERIRRAIELVG